MTMRPPGWEPDRKTKRDRPAALALAAKLATELHARPERFAQLAAQHSDDLPSAPHGGSLGTVSAVDLFPEVLDAIAVMKPNDVSRVIETDMGFQILQLRETPPEQTLSASQIVIGYRETESFDSRADRKIARTRAEAEKLAWEVAAQAKALPDSFDALVQEYSDHADVLRNGDIGEWSTHRPTPLYREIETVSKLEVGDISDPIDTSIGFRIFRRTPVTPRGRIALTGLHVPYLDPPTPPAPLRSEALEKAIALRLEVDADPSRLPKLQRRHCCAGVESWEEGRGVAIVEHALRGLEIGEVSQLIDVGDAFRIVQRVEAPPAAGQKPVRFELPVTAEPDFEQLVRAASDPRVLTAYIGELEEVAKKHGERLGEEKRTLLADLFAQLKSDMQEADPERRVTTLREFRAELRALLGARETDALRKRILERVVEDIAPELAHADVPARAAAGEAAR